LFNQSIFAKLLQVSLVHQHELFKAGLDAMKAQEKNVGQSDQQYHTIYFTQKN